MSKAKLKLCSLLLKEHFGCVVQTVGEDLLKSSSKPLQMIVRDTSLPLSKVKNALLVLINHNMVTFEAPPKGLIEYCISPDRVLYILRYPYYVHSIKTLYGEPGEAIIDEILKNGRLTMSGAIQKTYVRLQGQTDLEEIKDRFIDLVKTHFVQRCPYPDLSQDVKLPSPNLILPDAEMYHIPEVKLYLLLQKVKRENAEADEPPAKKQKLAEEEKQPDEGMYWRININRFHLYLRDQAIIKGIVKRFNRSAGEVVRTILRLDETSSQPNVNATVAVSRQEIYETLKKELAISLQEMDSYLTVLTDDLLEIMQKIEERGGLYSLNLKKLLHKLAESTVISIVQDRFGTKSCRIFRLLLHKKYIEQKQIEEMAMIPAKDAKELTYRMFQEKFIMAREIPRTPDYAPSRTFYLFHVDLHQVCRMLLEWCYKSVINAMLRQQHICQENERLLEKKQKVDTIVTTMEQNAADEAQIAEVKEMITPPESKQLNYVKHVTNKLEESEIQLDETIYILQTYINSLS